MNRRWFGGENLVKELSTSRVKNERIVKLGKDECVKSHTKESTYIESKWDGETRSKKEGKIQNLEESTSIAAKGGCRSRAKRWLSASLDLGGRQTQVLIANTNYKRYSKREILKGRWPPNEEEWWPPKLSTKQNMAAGFCGGRWPHPKEWGMAAG